MTLDGVWTDAKEKVKLFQSDEEAQTKADWVISKIKKWIDAKNV